MKHSFGNPINPFTFDIYFSCKFGKVFFVVARVNGAKRYLGCNVKSNLFSRLSCRWTLLKAI